MCLERQSHESALTPVNLWITERMGAPAADELPAPAPTGARIAGWHLLSPTPKKQSIVAAYEGEDCHHQRDDCDDPEPYPHHEKSMELWVEERALPFLQTELMEFGGGVLI